jgi:hypothetical protein
MAVRSIAEPIPSLGIASGSIVAVGVRVGVMGVGVGVSCAWVGMEDVLSDGKDGNVEGIMVGLPAREILHPATIITKDAIADKNNLFFMGSPSRIS